MSPSARLKTPARQAATYSPTLWPKTAAGSMPHDCQSSASAHSSAKSAGCAYAVSASGEVKPSGPKRTGFQRQLEIIGKDRSTLVEGAPKRRLGLVELLPHADVL